MFHTEKSAAMIKIMHEELAMKIACQMSIPSAPHATIRSLCPRRLTSKMNAYSNIFNRFFFHEFFCVSASNFVCLCSLPPTSMAFIKQEEIIEIFELYLHFTFVSYVSSKISCSSSES